MRRHTRLAALTCSLVLCLLLTGAKDIVKPNSDLYVNDQAGVLTAEDRHAMLAMAQELQRQTGAQVAALTVQNLEGNDISDYALRVAESWKLGAAGEDNGVLIVLAVEDRLSRIEVGYGLEGTLTDILTGRIQDVYMLPHYSQGDYSTGLREGFGAVTAAVYQHYGLEVPATLPTVPQTQEQDQGMGSILVLLLVLAMIILPGGRMGLPFLFLGGRGGHRGSGGGGGGFGGSVGGGGRFGGGGSSRRF